MSCATVIDGESWVPVGEATTACSYSGAEPGPIEYWTGWWAGWRLSSSSRAAENLAARLRLLPKVRAVDEVLSHVDTWLDQKRLCDVDALLLHLQDLQLPVEVTLAALTASGVGRQSLRHRAGLYEAAREHLVKARSALEAKRILHGLE